MGSNYPHPLLHPPPPHPKIPQTPLNKKKNETEKETSKKPETLWSCLQEMELVKIVGLRYELKPPRLCSLKLAYINWDTGKMLGGSFSIRSVSPSGQSLRQVSVSVRSVSPSGQSLHQVKVSIRSESQSGQSLSGQSFRQVSVSIRSVSLSSWCHLNSLLLTADLFS